MRDKNKNKFNSRQAVRSNPFMSNEAPSGGKSRQKVIAHQQLFSRSIYLAWPASLFFALVPRRHKPLRPQQNPCVPRHFPPPCLLPLSRRACRLRKSTDQLAWSRVELRMPLEVVPQAFLPVLCRLAGARFFPPLESLGEQQPLRESLVTLSGQGPCEQKPSLANCRFHTLAPGFLEGFRVRHISICALNAAVPDDPQKELVVRRPELPVVSVTRSPRHAPVQQSLHGLRLQQPCLEP